MLKRSAASGSRIHRRSAQCPRRPAWSAPALATVFQPRGRGSAEKAVRCGAPNGPSFLPASEPAANRCETPAARVGSEQSIRRAVYCAPGTNVPRACPCPLARKTERKDSCTSFRGSRFLSLPPQSFDFGLERFVFRFLAGEVALSEA